jgi:hypothetical protein
MNKNSKFYTPPTLKERLTNLKYMFLFWKGIKKGMIYTRDITLNDFRYIFFPKDFSEKYGYLGSVPDYKYYDQAMVALVLAMDYEAKPKWCPRWFLRFLDVFGNDRSIVRVRNWTLHNLFNKLTKGIRFVDYKTKWQGYDLRISISAPKYLQDLADDIEDGYYSRGKQKELVYFIKQADPEAQIIWGSISRLEKQLEEIMERIKKNEGTGLN